MVSVNCLLLLVVVMFVDGVFWLEQISRLENLQTHCGNLLLDQDINSILLDHILVDHKYKLLYCYVPKIACTNWKRIFMILNDSSLNLNEIPGYLAHTDNSTLKLSQLTSEQIQYCLKHYTTFLMVRHPFERLLSAYRNKFENNNANSYFQIRYNKAIRKYRQQQQQQQPDSINNSTVSFREFINFIINEGLFINEHWQPIYNLCWPCHINYTFIGHYETIVDDSNMLLEMIGIDLMFPLNTKNSGLTNKRLKYYFQQLSLNEIKSLYKLYQLDFKLFDYNLEELLGFDLAL